MKQEDKELLLKDLCARLYTCNCMNGTALIVALTDEQPLESNQWLISNYDCYKDKFIVSNIVYASDVERLVDIDNIKPYLFPLSSMTEAQQEEFDRIYADDMQVVANNLKNRLDGKPYERNLGHYRHIDWLNANHFDYRGLIPKGLAIDATGLNIY